MPEHNAHPPVDGNHALMIGNVMGALAGAGLRPSPVMDDGNYLDTLVVSRPSGDFTVVIRPVQMFTMEEFYERTSWKVGTIVEKVGDPGVRGTIVARGGQIWVNRQKLPKVRWDGKIDAVSVPWEKLARA